MIDPKERAEIERKVDAECDLALAGDSPSAVAISCLVRSLALACELDERGYDACMNAGTANFRANEEPRGSTHIGYFWQGFPMDACLRMVDELRILPEIHCWVVVPSLQLLVDPSIRFIPQVARESRITWTAPKPPHWLWTNHAVEDYYYEPHEAATEFVYFLIENRIKAKR